MQIPSARVRRITKDELLGESKSTCGRIGMVVKRPFFEYGPDRIARTISNYRIAIKNAGYSWRGRYPLLNSFLAAHKDKIRVFADVGAGNIKGAPTTIEARDILGPKAKIYAVDRKLTKSDFTLSWKGVQQLKHRITRAPLPFECDAIRFANVSEYMTREDVEKSLDNIWHSLKPHGFLLSAGPQDIAQNSGGSLHNEAVLIKVRKTKKCPHGFVQLHLENDSTRHRTKNQ